MSPIRARERQSRTAPLEITLPGAGQDAGSPLPSRDMIERRAYEIWLRHGCPSGTAFQDWLAAEAELRAIRGPR